MTEESAIERPRPRPGGAPAGTGTAGEPVADGRDGPPGRGSRRWIRRFRGPGMVRVSPVRGTVSGASAAA
ncbi:hypothetical protein GCM10018790_06650 [Kitasatospora xanthocidica]|nr:hypothetical protein GCM10018790_06650 [Kitasatospora xanthocidica]